jgi:hypothetical protein
MTFQQPTNALQLTLFTAVQISITSPTENDAIRVKNDFIKVSNHFAGQSDEENKISAQY